MSAKADSCQGLENELQRKENQLALELKSICFENGREKEPALSAKIFHKLGLVYMERSPDKISLIRSAGLFNAALARHPDNASEILHDLQELCSLILQLANSEETHADLIGKANHVKQEIKVMRQSTKAALKGVKQIDNFNEAMYSAQRNKTIQIQQIQEDITNHYKHIMSDISKYCEEVMGKAPCLFSLAGMGSIARKEITPYSDFEHIIVLEEGSQNRKDYNYILEYFRWFAVVFQVIILNLQETMLPTLQIPTLNDITVKERNWFFDVVTTRGVSFDGMVPYACKFPLGRQQPTQDKPWKTELIKPVSGMLNYLTKDEDLKNGYHLKDILTKTCYVYGNQTVYHQFAAGVVNKLSDATDADRTEEVREQIMTDISNFSTRFNVSKLTSSGGFNVKRVIYRSTTLFISGLGRIHNISASSCFGIVDELEEMNVVSEYASHKLKFAVALACEIRLRVYMEKESQDDWLIHRTGDCSDVMTLINKVGKASILNYFQIAYALQSHLCSLLDDKKGHFYSNLHLANVSICYIFGMYKETKYMLRTPLQRISVDKRLHDFDGSITQLEEQMHEAARGSNGMLNRQENAESAKDLIVKEFQNLSHQLKELNLVDDAVEYYERTLDILSENWEENQSEIADTLLSIGRCFKSMYRYKEALHAFSEALKIFKRISSSPERDFNVAWTLNNMDVCLRMMFRFEEALHHAKESLKIFEELSVDERKDTWVASGLTSVGLCLNGLERHDQALEHLEKAHAIYQHVSVDEDYDRLVSLTHTHIGSCSLSVQNFPKSLQHFLRALKIKQHISFDENTDGGVASAMSDVGLCLLRMQEYKKSLEYVQNSLAIHQRISLNKGTDVGIAYNLNSLGLCFFYMEQYHVALPYFTQSLVIYKRRPSNKNTDCNIAVVMRNIGKLLMFMKKFVEAMNYLEKALSLYTQASFNEDIDRQIARILINKGLCLLCMQRQTESLGCLQRALRICRNSSSNESTDKEMGFTLYTIGWCLADMKKYKEAFPIFQAALKVYETLSLETNLAKCTAMLRTDVGECLTKLHRYSEALVHFKTSIKLRNSIVTEDGMNRTLQNAMIGLGECFISFLKKPSEALDCLKKLLQNCNISSPKDEHDGKNVNNTIVVIRELIQRFENANQDKHVNLSKNIHDLLQSIAGVHNVFHDKLLLYGPGNY